MAYNSDSLDQKGANLESGYLAQFPVVIPECVRFQTIKRVLGARRTPAKIRSENQTYASNNNRQVRILFPNDGLYDTRNGYLTFDLVLTTTGGTYRRLSNGVFCIFDRLHIIFGAAEVEDLRDYNRLQSLIWFSTQRPQVTAVIGTPNGVTAPTAGFMGFASQAIRNILGLNASTSYVMPVYSGILNTELLPVGIVNGGFIFEFYIGDPTMYVESDGTVPVISISNIQFHAERLDLESQYLEYVNQYTRMNGLTFGFCSWERYSNSLTTSALQTIIINSKVSSLDCFFNLFLDANQISNMTINDRFTNWFQLGLTQYNMLINGRIFPDEPIDTVTDGGYEAYQMYCRSLGKWKLDGEIEMEPAITAQAYIGTAASNNQFLFLIDMQPYPGYQTCGMINPFTTLTNNGSINLKLVFAAVIPANQQCDSWIRFFKTVSIAKTGRVDVTQ